MTSDRQASFQSDTHSLIGLQSIGPTDVLSPRRDQRSDPVGRDVAAGSVLPVSSAPFTDVSPHGPEAEADDVDRLIDVVDDVRRRVEAA